jgi:HK97 family phage prohead protease
MKKKFYPVVYKSFSELGVVSMKELWEKIKGEYDGMSVAVTTEMTKAADSENKFHAVFSTATEDRHGDIVHQDWELKYFKKNPVFLDSHNYDSIVHILGKISGIKVESNKLQGDVEFMLDNPKGALAAKMAEGGFLNTTSVGFIPREFNDKGEIIKSELLEVSAVSVPANPQAQFEKSIKHTVTEEDLKNNPELAKQGVQVGDEIEIPEVEQTEEVDEPEQKPSEETLPEKTGDETKKINRTTIAAKVVAGMVDAQKKQLKAIARMVQELNDENKNEKKRKIYQAVRSLMSNI